LGIASIDTLPGKLRTYRSSTIRELQLSGKVDFGSGVLLPNPAMNPGARPTGTANPPVTGVKKLIQFE
jgi:hypothetical protein